MVTYSKRTDSQHTKTCHIIGLSRHRIENLQFLIDRKAKITVRVPLIPSFNTEVDVDNSIAILQKMGVREKWKQEKEFVKL